MFDTAIKRVSDSLQAIVSQNQAIRSLLETSAVRGHLYSIDTGQALLDTSPQQQLGFALSDISVPHTNIGGTSNVNRYPGYFACPPVVTQQIQVLNELKMHFNAVCKEAKAIGFTWRDFRTSYAAAGLATCHALQAGRTIHVLVGDIRGLGFTVARRIQSIQNMTLMDALQWLSSVEAYDVVDQLNERGYSQDALVRVMRPVANHLRVNVRYQEGSRQINGSMPVIVDNPDWDGVVKFNFPSAQPPKQRSDARQGADTIPLPFIRDGQLQIFRHPERAAG